jgi:glycosyltransferase involved in cell wall biosynthesis
MKVAVITPYHSEPIGTLKRCMSSVENQSHKVTHILVSDGSSIDLYREVEKALIDASNTSQHIRLPNAHADYGDTPRLIGTTSAYSQGFDAVCWLDADCWFEPLHISTLLDLANREAASVVTATRTLWRPDGGSLGVCFESDGANFCDTNCFLVMRDALPTVAPAWGFKNQTQSVVGDRRVWQEAKPFRRAHLVTPTVNYETKIASHYLERNEIPPPDARIIIRLSGEFKARSMLYSDWKRLRP